MEIYCNAKERTQNIITYSRPLQMCPPRPEEYGTLIALSKAVCPRASLVANSKFKEL